MAFDRAIAPDGYAWWYIDALSDDAQHGITLIIFLGSVFSPYYAWARARDRGDPLNFCAINVALYTPRRKLWTLTERGRNQLQRGASWIAIGPSGAHWDGNALTVDIAEITFPRPAKVVGRVTVHPHSLQHRSFSLDTDNKQLWRPIAPTSRVEVELRQPSLRWSGRGYLDMNTGTEPLESAFTQWHWSRATLNDGSTMVNYDVQRRDASRMQLSLLFDRAGELSELPPPASVALPSTRWGIHRCSACDANGAANVVATLEDTPFYARSLVSQALLGQSVTAVHESLSLDRFRKKWVQMLLPFRMPRRA